MSEAKFTFPITPELAAFVQDPTKPEFRPLLTPPWGLFTGRRQSRAWLGHSWGFEELGAPQGEAATVFAETVCALNIGLPRPTYDGLPARVWMYADPTAPTPMTSFLPEIPSVAFIRIATSGRFWCQWVFQIAHELGHVISNGGQLGASFLENEHHWLEEACCGALALFALHRMGPRWAVGRLLESPNFGQEFQPYALGVSIDYLTAGNLATYDLATWWSSNEAQLVRVKSLDAINKPLAFLLATQWLNSPNAWHDMRALNRWTSPIGTPLSEHLTNWLDWCGRLGTSGELVRFCQRLL